MGASRMRRAASVAIAATAALSLLGSSVLAAPGSPPGRDRTEAPAATASEGEVVVVTFADPPAASYEGGVRGLARTKPQAGDKLNTRAAAVRDYRAHLAGVHGDFERWLSRTAAGAQVLADYTIVANAVAVSGATAAQLQRGPGVVSAERVTTYRPTMNASVDQIGASKVWEGLGGQANAGDGVKVGIIDSGIDPHHPFFACDEDKVVLGGVYASGVMGVGVDIIFDHGTHVAGTVAGCPIEGDTEHAPEWLPAGEYISGVAPGAQLYDYNVFPGFGGGFIAFGGSAFSHDIASALEDAVEDEMDVVNLSLGGTQRGPNDFLDMALNAVVDAGVVAAVSAGNEGSGEATVGSPGTAANAITVGAVTNTHLVGTFIAVDNLERFPGATGDFDPFSGDNSVSDALLSDWRHDPEEHAHACTPADPGGATQARVAGTVTLIDRGDCTFSQKVANAAAAGAIGVLIVNNVDGPAVGPGGDGDLPALGISQDDGDDVRDLLWMDERAGRSPQDDDDACDAACVTITGELEEVRDAKMGDVLAGFSSRGPTSFTRALKPEIVAPGVNIVSSVFDLDWSTGDREYGWAAFQGTSMAAPHVAGAAALLLHDDGDLSPEQVKSALVNRAHDLGYTVLEQGAGRLDVPEAMAATVFAEPAAISFAHTKGNTNRAAPAISVELTDAEGKLVTGCSAETTGSAEASEAEEGRFEVTLAAPRELESGNNSGIVTVTCAGEQELRIPWYARVDRNR
jgi:minor extracellular serine protease Vpr